MDAKSLSQVPAFAEVEERILARLAASATVQTAPTGTVLFRRGERPGWFYILVDGQVALTADASDGNSTVIEVLRPTELFSFGAMLLDAPFLMSARAIEPSRVICLPVAEMRALIAAEPTLANAMLSALARQYREFIRQIADLKLRSAAQRLGCYLLSRCPSQNAPSQVKLGFDKRLLAGRLGTTPEHLSRAFATLREHGVTTRGALVSIDNPQRLAAFARPDETALGDRAVPAQPAPMPSGG
jgi:CRP/FNR family transcriptional activator FtrB